MTRSKRDANEAALIELWRGAGCLVIQMDRMAGFDLIVVSPHNGIHIVEVKDPTSHWKMTDREKSMCMEVLARNTAYDIIENESEALELIEP